MHIAADLLAVRYKLRADAIFRSITIRTIYIAT